MQSQTISYQELEAFHDVLEAARCYWYPQRAMSARAAEALRVVNQLYWRLGEYLPKTGTPSDRFAAVVYSSDGSRVERILNFSNGLAGDFSTANDPWWADTIIMSSSFAAELSDSEMRELRDSLHRLGLALELSSELRDRQMSACRRNRGPWAAEESC